MEIWETTISNLINIFHDALIALIPILDKAKIPWKNETAYDDWDTISEALYKAIVISPVEYAKIFNYEDFCKIPDYEFNYKTYANLSFISVNNNDVSEPNAFLGFSTKSIPFDHVVVAMLDKNSLEKLAHKTVPYEGLSFTLKLNKNGIIHQFDKLDVQQ